MSKDEAVELMKQGVKLTHTYFASEEWVFIIETGDSKIEAIYNAVLEFIEWYNKQPK